MATQAKQHADQSQKGFVRIQTQRSLCGDKVQITGHGCFLKDRNQEISCCNCFAIQFKEIKANCVTTVEGLDQKLKHEVILKDLKKMLRCDGETVRTEEAGVVLRLHDGCAEEVKKFLWKNGLAAKEIIKANCVTRVEGLNQKLKHDVILADLKKMLRCDGETYRTEEASVGLQLHDGRTKEVKEFLCKNGLAAKDKIHST